MSSPDVWALAATVIWGRHLLEQAKIESERAWRVPQLRTSDHMIANLIRSPDQPRQKLLHQRGR